MPSLKKSESHDDVDFLLVKYSRFMMYKAFWYTGRNHHDAEDLVSETIILALTKKDDWLNQNCKFTTWIQWRMLDAIKYFRFRRHIRQPVVFLKEPSKLENECDYNDDNDAEFMSVISKLPYPKLAVMNEQGYFDREIAKEFGVSRPTVHKWHKANKEAYEVLTHENHSK